MFGPSVRAFVYVCAALLCCLSAAPALASGFMESTCDVVAELLSEGKVTPDGMSALSVRVISAKETSNAGGLPVCEAVAGTEQTIMVKKPSGAALSKGDKLKLFYRDIKIYPTPDRTEKREVVQSKEWSFTDPRAGTLPPEALEAAPACDISLSLKVNGEVVAPGATVTLKRGADVTLTPVAHNNTGKKIKLAYQVPCPAGEIALWTLNGEAGALQGGCNMGLCAEPSSEYAVTLPPGEEKALGNKTLKLGKNACYEIPKGTFTLSFETRPQEGITACGPSPTIKIMQTP